MSLTARLTAVGFALGSAVHATAWVPLWFGIELYGPDYPPWRHVVFTVVDASIALIAVRRPRWLVFALVAFLVEQVRAHGVQPTSVLVAIAAIAAGVERWRSREP